MHCLLIVSVTASPSSQIHEFLGNRSWLVLGCCLLLLAANCFRGRFQCRCLPLGNRNLIPPNRWWAPGLSREYEFYQTNLLKIQGKEINLHQSNWINLHREVIQGIRALLMSCTHFFQNKPDKHLCISKNTCKCNKFSYGELDICCNIAPTYANLFLLCDLKLTPMY